MSDYQKEYSNLPERLQTKEFFSYLKEDESFKFHDDGYGQLLENHWQVQTRYKEKPTSIIDTSIYPIVKQVKQEIEIKDISVFSGSNLREFINNFEMSIKQVTSDTCVDGGVVNYSLRQECYFNGYGDEIFLDITSERLETEEEVQERLREVEENNKIINFQKFLDKKIKQYPLYLKNKEKQQLIKQIEELEKELKQ